MANVFERVKDAILNKEPVSQESETQKENFQSSTDWVKNLLNGKSVGGYSSKFISDVYNDRILYPHEEMQIATKAYKYNSYVNSAVQTRANIMLGGDIKVESENENVEEAINQVIKITGLKNYANKIGVNCITTGNWYAKRVFVNGKVAKYRYIPHSERIYADLDEIGNAKRYVQETPESLNNKNLVNINYFGDRPKSVKGEIIEKSKLFHLKLGDSEIDYYGRGPVASIINDIEILMEIERAIAVYSRYKAIPKHLLQMVNQDGDADAQKTAQYLSNQLSQLSDKENIVLGEQIKVDKLTNSGNDMGLDGFINYLKKKITVSLAPSFIMHGEETNYAVSQEQREMWLLRIRSERDNIAHQIKQELLQILPAYGITTDEFEVKFGDVDLGQTKQNIENARNAFSAGLITLNEAREMLGKAEDTEIGELYYPDMVANSSLMGFDNGTEQSRESVSKDSKNY